ncbi:MAG TPA: HAMP domain-containing sensor histidine kinase [Puia sp.]|jgi:signal transduction histidine kinase|nr:HAMP domain-containing sensor histidine kinase [Puia sp.]
MLLFTLLVTGIISLLTGAIYYISKAERVEAFDRRLRGRANYNVRLFSLQGDTTFYYMRRNDSLSSAGGVVGSRSVGIYSDSEEGKPIYLYQQPGTRPIEVSDTLLREAREKGEKDFTMDGRDAVAVHVTTPKGRYTVVVVGHDDDGLERLETLKRILLIGLATSIFLTALISFLFARQLLRPIALIIREVNEISSFDLSHRIRAGSGQDEMSQLANTFNELLARLQESFAIQRRFISNASHELSTPLTSVSSQVEVVLQKERSAEEYKQVLFSVREDVQQMRQLTKSLLEIAKTGSQGGIELNEVRIDEVLLKIVGDVKKLSAAYIVELDFGEFPEDEKDFVVFGNIDLLYIAIKNVVENGCKYSPDMTSLVDLTFQHHKVFIRVTNRGNVIPEDELPQIFQPFYRGSGTGSSRGFGLGLSLAQRIISLHKGIIHVQSDPQKGTCFTIELPAIKIFN